MKKRYIGYGLIISLILSIGISLFQYLNTPSDFIEYGFPFAVYEYYIAINRGRTLWLGIVGNILFTIVLGYFIGLIISFITKNKGDLEYPKRSVKNTRFRYF
jgi:hypothetical protein